MLNDKYFCSDLAIVKKKLKYLFRVMLLHDEISLLFTNIFIILPHFVLVTIDIFKQHCFYLYTGIKFVRVSTSMSNEISFLFR